MKKVTATITTNRFEGRFYNIEKDELQTTDFILFGNEPSLPDVLPYDKNLKLLKVMGEPYKLTKTYEMSEERFMQFAKETTNYKIGCVNRKIGGEVADIIVYNLEYDCVEEFSVENGSEKQIQKALGESYKLIKIKEVRKTEVKNYYMSYLEFIRFATVK